MKPTKLMGLVAAGIVIPSTAIAYGSPVLAREVQVKTANVEAVTRSDGSVYVNSGGNRISVPSRHSYRYWIPFRHWRLPWQSYRSNRSNSYRSNCRQSSYQSTSQITQSNSRIVQSSVTSNTCD